MDYAQKIDLILEKLGVRINMVEKEEESEKDDVEQKPNGDTVKAEQEQQEKPKSEETPKIETNSDSKSDNFLAKVSGLQQQSTQEETDDESGDEATTMLSPKS